MSVEVSKVVDRCGRSFEAGGVDRNGVKILGITRMGRMINVRLDPAPGGRFPRLIELHENDCRLIR